MSPQLVLRGSRRRFSVTDGQRLVVGRAPDCDVVVRDESVSRRHCRVEADAEGVIVADMGSANGTFVNGRAIATARLRPGDVLRIGDLDFECRDDRVSDAPAHAGQLGDAPLEPVTSRQIVPGRLDWLGPTAGGEAAVVECARRHLATWYAVTDHLARADDESTLTAAIVEIVLEVTGADRAALVLRRGQASGDEIELAAVKARDPAAEEFTVSRALVSDVIARGLSTVAHDASTDARYRASESVVAQRVRAVLCVPVATSDEILGALYVDSLDKPGRFSDADLELLASVGHQAGIALHRMRLMGDLERLFLGTVKAIAATVDAKDGYTHRHSERVAMFARRIAAELGLSADEQRVAELSALLHDVGKIALPDSILNKPDQLTNEEFAAVRAHPALGARILSNIDSAAAAQVIPGVMYHHEKWDGTGYPEGLSGEAIPLLGRLMGVADCLDAVTSARTYRPERSMDAAVRLVMEGAGTQFDPRIADAVASLHARGELVPNGG